MTSTEPPPSPAKRKLNPIMTGVAAVVALCVVLYGIVQGARKEPSSGGDCSIAASIAPLVAPLAKGEAAALQMSASPRPFTNASFLGPANQPLTVSDFRGKTVLLNLWATWCVPCRQEMPALDQLQARLGGPSFEVVAIDVDTARLDRRRAFLQEAGVTSLTFYADPTAQILRTLRDAGPVVGLPTSFLIAPDGCGLGAMLGPAAWASADAVSLIQAAARKRDAKS